MALAPCPACRRHVDVSGVSCPFCGAACSGLVTKGAPIGRMSRKALVLASSMAIVGCSDAQSSAPPYGAPVDAFPPADTQHADAPSDAEDSGPADTGSPEDSGSDVEDTGGPLPPYGLPPSDGG